LHFVAAAEGRLVRLPVRQRALRHRIDLIYRVDAQFDEALLVPCMDFLRGHRPAGDGELDS
jgi:hypothetical protein